MRFVLYSRANADGFQVEAYGEGAVVTLDRLEAILRPYPGVTVTRQLPERLVVYAEGQREAIAGRVQSWLERAGGAVERATW